MIPRILGDTRRIQFMTQFILRAWAYLSLTALAVLVLIYIFTWLFNHHPYIGAAALILGLVSLYLCPFAKLGYDQKIRKEEYAVRETERAKVEAEWQAREAERDLKWKEAQRKRDQDQEEKEKLAELERAARQRRIQELSSGEGGMEQAG